MDTMRYLASCKVIIVVAPSCTILYVEVAITIGHCRSARFYAKSVLPYRHAEAVVMTQSDKVLPINLLKTSGSQIGWLLLIYS
jgi:hypothetical protein